MSFAFPSIDPETSGNVTDMPIPIGRYLDAAYAQGEHDSILGSIQRMREVSAADADLNSEMLSPEEATKRWGVGDLKFRDPVRESVAQVLNQRKLHEIDREYFLSRGSSEAPHFLKYTPWFVPR